MKQRLRETLTQTRLLFDGAFGTYYALKYDTQELPELANERNPGRVEEIHQEYINAGAQIIRTNTYASNTVALHASMEQVQQNIR